MSPGRDRWKVTLGTSWLSPGIGDVHVPSGTWLKAQGGSRTQLQALGVTSGDTATSPRGREKARPG